MALYCNGKALIINGTMYCNGKVLIIICSPTKARATAEYFFPACASIHITSFFQHHCHPQNKLTSPTRIPWSSQGGGKTNKTVTTRKFVGRCDLAPRRFQVKSIIDKVSAVAMLRQCCPLPGQLETAAWQPGGKWGSHVKVLTHGKLARKEKSTESLKIQQGHEHCVHFIGIM